jgi:aromatic ring-cleaving dioxygenase
MLEVNFRKEALDSATSWLEKNRADHIVLIHPLTGDDLTDHTAHAKWLETPLLLNLEKLQLMLA